MLPAESDSEYAALLADVSTLYETHQEVFVPAPGSDARRVAVYWQMGRRIVDVVQQGKERGGYGQKVLLRLSSDLRGRFGRGFSDRTVRHIRRFAIVYRRDELRPDLSWSHYRALLSVESDELRRALEQRAVDEKLSRDQLLTLISSESRTASGASSFPLEPRNAFSGVYKVVLDAATQMPLLDLGFNVIREQPIKGVRDLREGELLRQSGSDRFARVDCESGARYCYFGEVRKVIDGDTVKMRMTLGFGTRAEETMRLRGVDAAEIDTAEGKKAHRALSRMLKDAGAITVFTYSHDRYGRYIADLVVDEKYINKALVESGAARFLKM